MSPARQTLILVLLVAALALPALPTRDLLPTDEPRFALVARQMVEDPAPLVPHLGYEALSGEGEVYADKPPLFFWLVALASLLTGGVDETAARLPSFLAAIAAVLLTRRIAALLLDPATGFAAAAILATTSQFFLRAGWCSIDMVLTALALAATLCWLRAARARAGGTGLAALGGLFAAAGTLAKGPVGLLFPLAMLLGDRLSAGRPARPAAASPPAPRPDAPHLASLRGRGRVIAPLLLAAFAAYLTPLLIWIAASGIVGGQGYLIEILFKQNVTRYVAAWNNQQPWYYYLYRLPIGLLPWTLLLPGGLVAARGLPESRARPLRGLLIASAIMLVFFTATTGKRGVYLLPIYPALAILIAEGWRRTDSVLHRLSRWVHLLTLAAAGLAGLVVLPRAAAARYPDLAAEALATAALIAAFTVSSVWLLVRRRAGAALATQIGGVALLVLVGSFLVVPEVNRRAGLREFGARLAGLARPGDFLVVDQEGFEQILFYSHLKGARRSFDETAVSVEDGRVRLSPRRESAGDRPRASAAPGDGDPSARPGGTGRAEGGPGQPEHAASRRAVVYPEGSRVLFVVKAKRADRLREALGPSARTLAASRLQGEPYLVLASRP